MRFRVRTFSSLVLLASLFSGINIVAIAPANAAVACDAGVTAQSGITVAPKHGKVFYVDTGQSQNVDAAYVAYQITAGSTKTNVWDKLKMQREKPKFNRYLDCYLRQLFRCLQLR